jgi:hypothetical protein
VRHAGTVISLAKRPVLFVLARALGEAWPEDVPRDTLVARAFRLKHADESLRARLRVEVGRLRKVLRTLADVNATKRGFALAPRRARDVVVLAPPVEELHALSSRFSPTVNPGRARRLRSRSERASAPVQRSLDSLAAQARCSRSVAGALVAG